MTTKQQLVSLLQCMNLFYALKDKTKEAVESHLVKMLESKPSNEFIQEAKINRIRLPSE